MSVPQYVTESLKTLCGTPGVGGMTQIADVAKSLLSQYTEDIQTDPSGNVFASIYSTDKHAPTILLEAHMDEIGFVVTSIDDNGFVQVSPCGGVDTRVLACEPVVVYGTKPILGVFCSTPPHLRKKGEEDKPLEKDGLYIDVGLSVQEAKTMIPLGSRVAFRENFTYLQNNLVASKSLDNRAGMTAVLYCLSLLQNAEFPYTVKVLFATGEELGCRGAVPGSFSADVIGAVVTDVSFALTPDTKAEKCGKMGEGTMIGVSPSLDAKLSSSAISVAEKHSIAYQLEVLSGKTGTDADVITVSKTGVPTVLLSIPLKYMHTPVETVDLRDVCATGECMAMLIQEGVFTK